MNSIVIIIFLILAFIFGFLAGIPITLKLFRAGVLLIDTSNPEKDMYSFQLETPLDKLPEENYISLKNIYLD